jgi:hypothetical protein
MQSVYIELAIGLALAFFLLSLLVSGAQEAVNRAFGIRGKFLWAYLGDLLEGPTAGNKSRLPASLADILLRLPSNKLPRKDQGSEDPRPQFDPRPPPASVTQDRSLTQDLYERLQGIDFSSKRGRSNINHIPPARFAVAIVELVEGKHNGDVGKWLEEPAVAKSPLRVPLAALWRSADNDREKFRLAVERWFDGEMERLTQHYRRSVRWVIGVLAVLVTLLVGLDAIAYGKALLTDQAFRSEVVAVASGNPDKVALLKDRCVALGGADGQSLDPYACVDKVLAEPAVTTLFRDALFGVRVEPGGTTRWSLNGREWRQRLFDPEHWLGYLMTIVALLFGAPFWWDVLRRFTGVRVRRTPPAA